MLQLGFTLLMPYLFESQNLKNAFQQSKEDSSNEFHPCGFGKNPWRGY